MSDLSAEDAKILTLARSASARSGGVAGAAVRDEIGRTYAAGPVSLASLRLSALQAAIAAAVSSGSTKFEAVAVVADEPLSDDDLAVLAEVGDPVLLQADRSGAVRT